ncbi:MAG: hypothetical protein HYU83_02760 [Chloroflexi bacterium]|nr:hypothetical protein [Chloroflexota bacterium]
MDNSFMDEYPEVEEPEGIEDEQSPGELEKPGLTKITIRSDTFFVKLHESYQGSLELLERGIETAEEAYQFQKLLKFLKSRVVVKVVDADGCETDGPDARRAFVEALKEREALHAWNLKERLAEQGAEW